MVFTVEITRCSFLFTKWPLCHSVSQPMQRLTFATEDVVHSQQQERLFKHSLIGPIKQMSFVVDQIIII